MPNDRPHLPLARYELTYRATENLSLPTYPRGLWHGAFGANLKTLSCVVPDTECRNCLLLHHCHYSYLFSGPRPPDTELMRRYDTIPVPHIFHVDAALPPIIHPGQAFAVSLVLLAKANERLPLVIQAMAAIGETGLGAKRGRSMLEDVVQHLPSHGTPRLIAAEGRILPADAPEHPQTPPMPARIRIRFLSPYKSSGDAAGPGRFDPGRFLMAVVRRTSLLQYFYTGNKLEADFLALKAASQQARITDQNLHRQTGHRSSANHGGRVDTSGLLGHIDLAMDGLEPLWPYLHLGQWLGVGKNASMGYGRFDVLALAEVGAYRT